ncbi:S8 family serine peptidase [Umezawaea sp. NPDC059074]|uniref:S8 family serine peptidase n=1 Tax=Umezawaea sp. NPDC059074 TaxID=3346716 RepID=UPI0036B98ADB
MTIRSARRSTTGADHADLPDWPQRSLDRHGGRTLRPVEATRRADGAAIDSTVYRAAVMLMPRTVLADAAACELVDAELNSVGLSMKRDTKDAWPTPELPDELYGLEPELRDRIPIPVVLFANGPTTSVVDAWTGVQQIRLGVAQGRITLLPSAVNRISVEHLLVGAAFGGVPTWSPHDLRAGDDGGGWDDPYRLLPVAFTGAPPHRRECAAGERRVVVAVPDSGLNAHPWFGVEAVGDPLPVDGFVRVYEASETVLREQGKRLGGLTPTQVLVDAWEDPLYTDELSEEIGRAAGHFTFIAGRIRQNAPDADVLALRVLHPDNVCYEADLLLALWMLVARIKQGGHVDVVSLSLGGYVEDDSDAVHHLREVITALTDLGVVVVAAAGNDATTRPFYPAALAAENPLVLSVGALNPDDTEAWFSNAGSHVTHEATGANVLSSFPTTLRGARGARMHSGSGARQTADPDSFASGFAIGSGTSYAAPEVAAAVAVALTGGAVGIPVPDPASRVERAADAVKGLPT